MAKLLKILTPEQLQNVQQETQFDDKTIIQHIKRYSKYDSSKNASLGIQLSDLLMFPEFCGHPFIERIIQLFLGDNLSLLPETFLLLCGKLSSVADITSKRQLAFQCFDLDNAGVLKYDEVYKMYRMIFKSGSLTEDQMLDLTFRALNMPELLTPGQITSADFENLVSNGEIKSKFTIDLQLPPP